MQQMVWLTSHVDYTDCTEHANKRNAAPWSRTMPIKKASTWKQAKCMHIWAYTASMGISATQQWYPAMCVTPH